MRTGNYIYVDKTEHIYNLFKEGGRYYFLSRPRRFGKSLLISTLHEFFRGNKKLFENLWIANKSYDWQDYPVILLDFSTIAYGTPEELKTSLAWNLDQIATQYSVEISGPTILKDKFKLLIQKLAEKNKVVLLVDEYDKPILDHIADTKKAETIREILREFYDALKGTDGYMKAIFITGVTKFAKTSIFSGINNVDDISILPEAAEILGYTKSEICSNFTDTLNQISKINNSTLDEELKKMQHWYNGYRFSNLETKVFNPFSILYYLKNKLLRNYWFESGTPTFLISYLQKNYENLEGLEFTPIKPSSLTSFDIKNIPLIPLLFQAGYLTFDVYNKQDDTFTLTFPNLEVEESFKKFLVTALANIDLTAVDRAKSKLLTALNNNDLDSFCTAIKQLFAHIPSILHIKRESYYHSLFQFLLSFLSLDSQSEILTNKGRIDLVLSTKTHIYIFEVKLDDNPENALKQIHEKKYYEKFIGLGKKIALVGLNFSTKKEHFDIEYVVEQFKN